MSHPADVPRHGRGSVSHLRAADCCELGEAEMVDKRPEGLSLAALLALALVVGSVHVRAAWAAEHVMKLVTEDANGRFHFEPALVVAEPGDSVRFEPDGPMHAVKSVAGMLPEGVAPWRGRMGEELVVQLDRPGLYGVKCRSGYEVGMVGTHRGRRECAKLGRCHRRSPPTGRECRLRRAVRPGGVCAAPGRMRELSAAQGSMRTSTRRLARRPSAVPLLATGSASPFPSATTRAAGRARLRMR